MVKHGPFLDFFFNLIFIIYCIRKLSGEILPDFRVQYFLGGEKQNHNLLRILNM
jgi:low temperature requirement protein LtrA